MQPSPRPEPIGLLVAAVRRAINAAVLARAEPHGLSSQQFWILIAVLEASGSSQAELAARLRRDEPSVSRVMRTLCARGWVRTRRGAEDRRRQEVVLTPSGRALARKLRSGAERIRAAVEEPLTRAEAAVTRAALQKIAARVSGLAPPNRRDP